MYNKKTKKALSPIVITILLVLLAIILAILVYIWARGFIKEGLTKFGEPIERACEKVNIELSGSGSEIMITNTGDVPIYKIKVAGSSSGISSIVELNETITAGQTKTFTISGSVSGKKIIPVLLGNSKDNSVNEFQCPKAYWKVIE